MRRPGAVFRPRVTLFDNSRGALCSFLRPGNGPWCCKPHHATTEVDVGNELAALVPHARNMNATAFIILIVRPG